MTNREQQILSLLRDDPMLPQHVIAARLGISRSAVAGHIMNLTRKGAIKGRGYVLGDAPFVAVIGGANIDIHGKSNKALRRKDSNPGTVHTSAGGVARNIAENLARLGVDCRLISAVGNDHHGQMLLRLGRDAGIDMRYVHEIASAPTSTYLSVLDDTGDMQVAIADMSIIDGLGAERLQPQQAMLQQSILIILDTNLPDDALDWLTGTFAATPIFADTVSTTKALRIKPYLASIHTLKTGTLEVEALTGMEARTPTQLRKLAGQLHSQGVERLFITRGDQGVFYSTGDAQGTQKLKRDKRDVHNAGGAGDAFLAGLAFAWLEDRPLSESVRFALAAADITLSHAATSSPALSLTAINRVMETQRVG
ncbi:MAG: PfkB family carbohydrate kinase [Gammaproteobacteria bacterium]|jgi:pseudouridine kinase|nr:PfkB family carbohydrate kinase [Gammaproteobacteria bacterium]MDH3751798.1 PfkB family carbohydrate kinase [Gammaproteobacteria bacterium]MDH3806019.1 PfkB family carbohydrate kinase [Gammaproteobacteria bacterium]